MNPFEREPRQLKRRVNAAIKRVLESRHYVLGPEVAAFEQEWSAFTGIPHTVGVGNGMDALELGMRALGIGPGDEVITTAITAFATVVAIRRVGATPVIADIDPCSGLLSLDSVKTLLSSRTKAVIFVHLYGRAGNMPEWVSFTNEHSLYLIEDCAQAHGAKFDGKHVGSFGIFGAFSFYPTKNLGAVGDGGALVTSNEEVFNQVRVLRNYGQLNRYEHISWGANSRLDELQAAVLRARLEWLPAMNLKRQQNALLLRSLLESVPGCDLLDPVEEIEQDVSHLFVVRVQERDLMMRELQSSGIEVLVHYPIASHHQEAFELEFSPSPNLEAAETHAQRCLTLPSSPWLRRSEAESLVSKISHFLDLRRGVV